VQPKALAGQAAAPPPAPTLGGEPSQLRVHDGDEPRTITAAELVVFTAACVVGLVALVSLAAAHLHHHTPLVVAAGSVLLIAPIVAAVYWFERPAVRLDLAGLAPLLVGLGLAALMMFPGFRYATGDKDPGAYVEHAAAISRTHSIDFSDDLFASPLPSGVTTPDALPDIEWPALWNEPGHPGKIFPQFYHLWPALLATAKDTGGFTGLFDTGPLVGVVAVGLAVVVARRLAGLPAAWAVAFLLSTNMLEVWQAKYPSAEIFGQMLVLGTLLGVVLAIRARWRTGAALAGALLALSYLERPDGIVLILIAWGVLAALLAARRFDSRAAWFTGALVALLPYGFYQAYHLARIYTLANNVPSLAKLLTVMIAVAVLAGVLAWQGSLVQRVIGWASAPRIRFRLGTAFVMVCAALLAMGRLRPHLVGIDYMYAGTRRIRSYDELSVIRLGWFFSQPGLLLMLGGVGYVAWRRWRLDRWLVALATAGLLTLYCYHLRNSPYLMWATRRFVTSVVPGMVLLMGFGVALIVVVLRRYVRVPYVAVAAAAAVIAGLTVFFLSESWPLRSHDENTGSLAVEQRIAALSGEQRGVFLWQRSNYCCDAPWQLFGGPLLATMGESSILLPTSNARSAVADYVAYFKGSGRPVFYVADKKAPPPPLPGVTSGEVLALQGVLPHWEETSTSRPKKRHDYPYQVTVYRLAATSR
jgi:hypothetical protein